MFPSFRPGIIALLLVCSVIAKAQKPRFPKEKEMGAYLMVYFKDDTHGLYMALSKDGYSFTDINNAKPIIAGDTIAEQKGIRDPYIYRAPDGLFYLALTDLHIYGQKQATVPPNGSAMASNTAGAITRAWCS